MRRLALLIAAACALLSVSTTAAIARSRPRVPVAHAAALPHRTRVLGAVAPRRSVAFTLGLRSRDPLGLRAMATGVGDRRSPYFGRVLTARQFAARFGAPERQLDAIRADLRAQGLTIHRTEANRLTIEVDGPAAAVQRALGTRLAEVRLPDGRRGVANTAPATLPAPLAAGVQTVLGLDPAAAPRPAHSRAGAAPRSTAARRAAAAPAVSPRARPHVATGGPQPCAAATSASATHVSGINNYRAFGYTADLIAHYYGFDTLYAQGYFGQGQSIALPEGQVVNPADIAAYGACYGVAPNLATHDVQPHGAPDADDTEAALDIEQIMGLAPQAHIDVFQEPGGQLYDDAISAAVSANIDKVVSVSYGGCEPRDGSSELKYLDTLFQEAAAQGQSVAVSSGDDGSESCYRANGGTGVAVDDYAGTPDALGVGATSLYAGGTGAAEAPYDGANAGLEGVWNLGGYPAASGGTAYAATGGGRSILWAMPAYQSGAAAGLGVVNALSSGATCGASASYCREVPDVSADGDQLTGYTFYVNDGSGSKWEPVGGTSASTPLWAAALALANENPACRGTTLGLPNPYVYAAAGANYTAYFRDATQPSPTSGATTNDVIGTGGGLFPITGGYDMTTGLGTPIVGALAPELCSLRAPVYTVTIANPGTPKAYRGNKYSLKLATADQGNLPLTVSVAGLPAGLTFDKASSAISGRPSKLGTYPITVSAVDGATNSASLAFRLRVVKKPLPKPKIGAVALHGVGRRHPSLSFTVRQRGRKGSKAKSLTIRLPKGLSFGKRHKGIHLSVPGHRRRKVRFTAHRSHGALVIRFKAKQSKVTVTIGRGTLFARKAIARTARRHAHRKVKVGINVVDGQGFTGRHTFHLRFKR